MESLLVYMYVPSMHYIGGQPTSKLKILRIKKREYRDGIKRKETRLGWS